MRKLYALCVSAVCALTLTSCNQTFNCRCVVTDPDTNVQTEFISVGTYSSFFGMKKQAKESCEVKKDDRTEELVTCTLE